jgi:hypothetical protein
LSATRTRYKTSPGHRFRRRIAGFDGIIVGLGFEDEARKAKLVQEFLLPLLAEGSWENEEDGAPTFGPALRDDESGFNRLAEANLVGQDHAFGERGAEGCDCGVNLVRVEVHAG